MCGTIDTLSRLLYHLLLFVGSYSLLFYLFSFPMTYQTLYGLIIYNDRPTTDAQNPHTFILFLLFSFVRVMHHFCTQLSLVHSSSSSVVLLLSSSQSKSSLTYPTNCAHGWYASLFAPVCGALETRLQKFLQRCEKWIILSYDCSRGNETRHESKQTHQQSNGWSYVTQQCHEQCTVVLVPNL